jgi:hypothetical protein
MKYSMKLLTGLLLFFVAHLNFSQNAPEYVSYAWDANPKYTVEDTSQSIVAVKHKVIDEFYFKDRTDLVEYYLEHKVLWLNSDDKIEEYNKIYLPFSGGSELKVSKARVINAKGDIIELDESKILSASDEETGRQYRYFALEGIDKGSFIEYYYVIEQFPEYRGKRITFQTDYPKKDIAFDLLAPSNLEFKFKSYNGLADVTENTENPEKFHWQLRMDQLDGLEEESQAAYHASKAYLIFKLDKNLFNNTTDISSYGNVAQNIYAYYHQELPKKTAAALTKLIEEATKTATNDEASKVRKLEFYIKSNFFISEGNDETLKDIDKILSEKVANDSGIMKLYIAALDLMEIPFEIVFTSDRQSIMMDPEFEAENFLTNILLYFPNTDAYLDPMTMESRYGFPSGFFTDNYGLFIKEIKLGDNKSGVGKIKYIEPVSEAKTFDRMRIDVSFDPEDPSISNIKLDREMHGYYAMFVQPFIHLAKPEDKEELIESFAKNIVEEIDIKDKRIMNDDPELFGIKPLHILVDFSTEALTEKAGRKYLFKLGDVIGPQIQLYQEKARVLPVEEQFNRSYFRTINVTVPKGYRLANASDINIKNIYTKDGKELFSFHSYYTLDGDLLTITADEHYRKNHISTDLYEAYRTVINSAADFNKITLVFEPIQ